MSVGLCEACGGTGQIRLAAIEGGADCPYCAGDEASSVQRSAVSGQLKDSSPLGGAPQGEDACPLQGGEAPPFQGAEACPLQGGEAPPFQGADAAYWGKALDVLALAIIWQAAIDAQGAQGEKCNSRIYQESAREWLEGEGRDWLGILGVRRQKMVYENAGRRSSRYERDGGEE